MCECVCEWELKACEKEETEGEEGSAGMLFKKCTYVSEFQFHDPVEKCGKSAVAC